MSDATLLQKLRRWADNISPGGSWYYGGDAGVWALYLNDACSGVSTYIGFRPSDLAALVKDAEEAPRLRARVAELEGANERLENTMLPFAERSATSEDLWRARMLLGLVSRQEGKADA